jgi:D-tyrosyl-tRNA(Tyr) deacylase
MRALLQRVTSADVVVAGASVGRIGPGILALVGVGREDSEDDVRWLVGKLLGVRLFEAGGKPWAASLAASGGDLLLVSQFTLHASSRKPKPDFHRSAGGDDARRLFDAVVSGCRAARGAGGGRVETGQFGAMMSVSLTNDGPVTIWLDSKNREDELWERVGKGAAGGGEGGEGTPAALPEAGDAGGAQGEAR